MSAAPVVAHDQAAVSGEAIPEKERTLTAEVVAELAQELDQALVCMGARAEMEVEPGATTVPAVTERRGCRGPRPVPKSGHHISVFPLALQGDWSLT